MINIKGAWLFIGGMFVGVFATAFVHFPATNSSEWAAWCQAIGAIIAIAVAIYVPYQQRTDGEARDRKRDELRRKEPLMSLQPIMERALSLLEKIPLNETTDIYVEHFFAHVSDPDAVSTVRASLIAFPIERLIDFQAIQSVFEMQDALKTASDALRSAGEGDGWAGQWPSLRQRFEAAAAQASRAKAQFKAALDDAGISNYVTGSAIAKNEWTARADVT